MTTEVEKAEATIKTLEDKQRHLNQRATELADERNRIAFSAHVEADPKSRKRLDQINSEMATMASEQASFAAALIEANARLTSAKRDEALAADRASAEQLRIKLDRFVELGLIIEDCLIDLNSASAEMKTVLSEMHNLGAQSPSHDQMRVLRGQALKTALMRTPWSKEFEHLAPNQRRDFKSLISGWRDQLMPSITARLGSEIKREEAA